MGELFTGIQISNKDVAVKPKFAIHDGHYCVIFLNAPLSDQDLKKKEKSVCNRLLFPGNLDPLSLTPGGPVVLLVCGFRRRDNLLMWCESFANLYELKSCI